MEEHPQPRKDFNLEEYLSKHQVSGKEIEELVQMALREDLSSEGDITSLSTIPLSQAAQARFLVKANGVLAGAQVIVKFAHEIDPQLKVEFSEKDGAIIRAGQVIGTVSGTAQSILKAERILLNALQRMSGISTATWNMVQAAMSFSSSGNRTQ